MRVEHYSRQNIPPGVVPLEMLTPKDLIALGLDPVEIYRMQDELAEMGLGLGISIGGIFKGIGKGIKGIAKGVGKGAKFVATKAVPFALKTGLKVAPLAAGGYLAVKYGPALVGKAAGLFKKHPSQVTEADVQRAQQAATYPTPAVAPTMFEEPRTWYNVRTGQAVQSVSPPDRSLDWSLTPPTKPAGDEKSLFDKALELVTRIGPAVPQVAAAAETVREVVSPTPPPAVAPSNVTVTVPGAGEGGGGVQQAGVSAGMPSWLPIAAGLAALALFRR